MLTYFAAVLSVLEKFGATKISSGIVFGLKIKTTTQMVTSVSAGFDYVAEKDGIMLFRGSKRFR